MKVHPEWNESFYEPTLKVTISAGRKNLNFYVDNDCPDFHSGAMNSSIHIAPV